MDTTLLNLKIKRYLTQYEYLELELEETEYLFNSYNKRFIKEYYDIDEPETPKIVVYSEDDLNNMDLNDNIDSETDDINENDIHIKKLYKLLSLKTHPDKNNGSKDSKEIFSQINAAYKEKNILKLFKFALDYKINLTSDIMEACISHFDITINEMQTKINTFKTTLAWCWCNSSEEEKEIHRETLKKANI